MQTGALQEHCRSIALAARPHRERCTSWSASIAQALHKLEHKHCTSIAQAGAQAANLAACQAPPELSGLQEH